MMHSSSIHGSAISPLHVDDENDSRFIDTLAIDDTSYRNPQDDSHNIHNSASNDSSHDDNDENAPLLALSSHTASDAATDNIRTLTTLSSAPPTDTIVTGTAVRSRKSNNSTNSSNKHRRRKKVVSTTVARNNMTPTIIRKCLHYACCCCCCKKLYCCRHPWVAIAAKLVFWGTLVALMAAVMWYSYELANHGTDPHLIAWFSAGAFVLLGFPISMWGIFCHFANYNQPHVQVYVIRILWMVPIYSVESWLAMKFHKQAIYIETLRDLYESYVLYSFLQFLIQILGGEQALILLLKDKSPTRGSHMWGLQWCVKPWLMGQPVRRSQDSDQARRRVHWKSPFFIQCKFGVLQYVLLKFVSAVAVMGLEIKGWYKEGDFTPKGGYLYICILTNLSQCWALYCLIFFYYATHNELSPIRPVGKFLSVKALVFFTWWQSVIIAILYQMDMIPHYDASNGTWTQEDVAKGIQDYLICIEMFFAAVVHVFVFPHTEYTPQAVEARARAWNQTPMKWHKKRLGRGKYMWDDATSKSSRYDVEMATLGSENSYPEAWEMDHTVSSPQRMRASSLEAPLMISNNGSASQLTLPDWTVTGNSPSNTTSINLVRVLASTPVSGNHIPLEPVQDVDQEDDGDTEEVNNVSSADSQNDDIDATDYDDDDDDDNDDEQAAYSDDGMEKPSLIRALWDSAIPRDLRDNTVGIVKGDYIVEKKTLLYHAATSDQYDLFSTRRAFKKTNEE